MKRHLPSFVLFAWLAAVLPSLTVASRFDYYDWGPYYQPSSQVLGVTFSSGEGLPPPPLSPDLLPPPATGILPGDLLAPAEFWAESLQLTFTFDALAREQLRLQFASERIAEAQTLVEQQRFSDAALAISGYRDTMQTLASNLQDLARTASDKVTQLLQQVETTAADQAVVAQTLAASAPPAVAETWTQVVTASEKALDAVADATGQPPIPDSLSAGIQELKNQGLITPEESEKLYALDSRSEVRAELDKLVTSGQFPPAEVAKLDTAVAANHPDIYQHQQDVLEFAELRSYQTLPSPNKQTLTQITAWQKNPGDLPPPPEIRPYLYYDRAQELARAVDLTRFSTDQQSEVVRFYSDAVTSNPTFTTPQEPLPSPTPPPPTTAVPYLTAPTGSLPGDPTYFLKRFGEQLFTTFTFDPARRAERYMQLAEERLREASVLADQSDRNADYVTALKDYTSTVVAATRIVDSQDVARIWETQMARHNLVLEKGLLPPPTDQPELTTTAISATQDALDTSADTLGRPALPQALSDRLQDLKAQGLILPEEVAALTAAETRGEVRDQIRQLEKEGIIPPAEAKRLDEAQSLTAPGDYNQLVEVRKIEELNRLRAIQAEFAQTATLRATTANLEQRQEYLKNSIDPSLIRVEDLAGNAKLKALYQQLADNSNRPVNAGQFPASPGGSLAAAPVAADAVLTTCPAGAVFKQYEGCVWADSGKKLNDYEQYRCTGGQYWSFAAQGCIPYQPGYPDGQPVCPVGYVWTWQTQACTTSASPTPSGAPLPSPEPGQCPVGSSYQAPNGCVWDDTGKSITDYDQYRCDRPGEQYYSFTRKACVNTPTAGETTADGDYTPSCATNPNHYWSWDEGRCIIPQPVPSTAGDIRIPPSTLTPTSPFYFIDRAVESIQIATAFTPEAKEKIRLAQAQERLGEAYALLQRGQEERFRATLGEYTATMQTVYNDLSSNINLSDTAKASLGEQLANQIANDSLILQKATALATETESTATLNTATSATIQGIDRAADLVGEPAIPAEIQARLDSLPPETLTDAQKTQLDQADNRLEARLAINALVTSGVLTPNDTTVLDQELMAVNPTAVAAVGQLRSLVELDQIQTQSTEIKDQVSKNENIVQKLNEFQATFTPGSDIPAEIRPYLRLSRIEEVAQTIRPDIVRLEDFANRKDVQLAVATLREEFRPTPQLVAQVEAYRRGNPGRLLPPELARIEALFQGLGVRDRATACFLPSPPFAANTPCPPPGAALPISNYYSLPNWYSPPNWPGGPGYDYPVSGTGGEQLTYGKGPEASKPGVCQDGYHWMYDSGGWCMSNSGNYAASTPSYNSTGPGYTPYTPYYSGPGSPGYTEPGSGNYSPPYYYGPAPTYYTTNPPPGTVPGTGPTPTSPGQCPSGFHWMSDSGGWCMSDGPTYVPSGSTPGYYSPNLTQESCGPGYYWDGRGCIPTYSGGSSGPSPANSCQGFSCPSGYSLDYSTCSCRSSGTSGGGTYSPPSSSCQLPSGGCGPNSWYDYGSCSCRSSTSTSTPTYSPPPSGSSSGSCPSGYHWMSDSGGWCMSDGAAPSTSSSPTPTYSPPPSSEPAPSSAPAPSSEPAPAPPPSEPAPPPAP